MEVNIWAVLPVAAGAVAVAAVIAALLARRRGGERGSAAPRWAAVLDRRGLLIESHGDVDGGLAVYAVQAARVMEEAGRLLELSAKLEGATITVTPCEEGTYRVVAW